MTFGALVMAGSIALGMGGAWSLRAGSLRSGLLLQALGAGLVGIGGAACLVSGTSAGAGFSNGLSPAVGIDPLSGVFLLAVGLVGVPALVYACGWLSDDAAGRTVGALTGLFVLVLILELCARDVLTFLAAWELMTLVPAALILVSRSDERARRTVFTYVSITHLGGVGTWIALLGLAHVGAIGNPAALARHGGSAPVLLALAALVGFGTKAGVMPLHVWLPRAHPIAPAHVSALMSGVMIKVALYGLVRVLVDWAPPEPLWLGGLVVGLGALSALGGVTYALFTHDLKRLLALHSIENVGIILLGIGAALVLRSGGDTRWASLALAAALLHTVNHAVFKALLFLGAGSFDRAVSGLDLNRLGGLLRRMPRTGWAFLIGSAAIAGIPPLNGFASEWLTLQGLLHLSFEGTLGPGLVGALALAALAMTAALAVYCFVKVAGLVLLGRARRRGPAEAVEAPVSMWGATAFLAASCVVLGSVPGLILPSLVDLSPGAPALAAHAGFELPATGRLPTLAIFVVLALLSLGLVRLRGARSAAPAATWICGQRVEPALDWTSAGFTKPLQLTLQALLRPRREFAVETRGGVVQRVSHETEIPHHFETLLYAPATRLALAGAGQARRLQSGRLGIYVFFLIGLVVALLASVRLGLLG